MLMSREAIRESNLRRLRARLEPLKGAQVIGVDVADVGLGEPAPLLIMHMPDGSKVAVIVLSDPEGNGPGHLDLQKIED